MSFGLRRSLVSSPVATALCAVHARQRPRNRRGKTAGATTGTKAGFVLLVEVVLAVFVFSIGILAGIALMASSVDTGREARADTQLAMFGDGILEWLRATATEAGITNGWAGFWAGVQDREIGIPVPAQDMWTPSNCTVKVGGPTSLVLSNYDHHVHQDTDVPALALRYVFEVFPRPPAGGRTNWSAHLKLWEGAFGVTNDAGARSFYTELFEPGVLR